MGLFNKNKSTETPEEEPKKKKSTVGLYQTWHFAGWDGEKMTRRWSVGKNGTVMMVVVSLMGRKGSNSGEVLRTRTSRRAQRVGVSRRSRHHGS